MSNKNQPKSMLIGLISLVAFVLILTLVLQNLLIPPDTKSGQALEIGPYPSPFIQTSPKSAQVSSSQPYPSPVQSTEAPRLPLCQFKLDVAVKKGEVPVTNYIFSEPQIVLESSQAIEIVEWLPDNQQVLLTQEDFPQQKIELFEPETKEIQVLASRKIIQSPPVWLPTFNAVLYTQMNVLDATKQPIKFTRQLWVSQKDTGDVYKIADELSNFSISIDIKSDRFVYLGDKQFFTRYPKSTKTQMVAIDPLQWTSPDEPGQDRSFEPPYNLAWRPGTSQIAFFSEKGLFLVDADTSAVVCTQRLSGRMSLG